MDALRELLDAPTWSLGNWVGAAAVIMVSFEVLAQVTLALFSGAEKIPMKARHHDVLTRTDRAFIFINKLMATAFVRHTLRFIWTCPRIKWDAEEADVLNTGAALVAIVVVYDFFYTLFHRALHIRAIYPYIHKHHHVQLAPSRGNPDAINVHPFEFLCGEYNHLFAVFLVTRVMDVHVAAPAIFILVGGMLASLNHTRFNIEVPGIYDVKAHDVHHRVPQSNYGQYIMLWDRLMGSFRPYH